MRNVNRNLCLQDAVEGTPTIYKIDGRQGFVYGTENMRLTKRSRNLKLIKPYENAHCMGLFEPERTHGLSDQTNTALIVIGDERQAFYNLSNNKFSKKIRVGRVIPSQEDGKWYCFDYRRSERTLCLRDITKDIHTILEWREFFNPRQKRSKATKQLMWFNKRDNFVHRPNEW